MNIYTSSLGRYSVNVSLELLVLAAGVISCYLSGVLLAVRTQLLILVDSLRHSSSAGTITTG